MLFSALTIVVGILLAIGGAQEFYFRGIVNHENQPFFVGLLGAITGILLVLAGVALVWKWSQWRSVALVGAVSNLVFLLYAAVPPHRNVGIFALLIGVIASTGLILQVVRQGRSGRGPEQRPAA